VSSKHLTVLIVDDDATVTQTFARMLRLEGYDVLTAASAETGLREMETGQPDVVLVDLRMPLVDGVAFLRELRAHEKRRHTPVAVVTGDYFFDDTISQELSALGASVYFKPLWLEDLIEITEGLLARVH
jgi:DNA-binding response OmpR family regulator